MTIDPSILLAVRVLGILVFGMAVAGKLRHRDEFVGVVANYRLAQEALAPLIAWVIIILEIFVAISLATGFARVAGAALAVSLLVAFAVAMAINLTRGRKEIDCGCFQSALRQRLSVALVVRNVLLIAMLLPLFLPAADDAVQLPSLLQAVNGVGAGVALFVLYQIFGQALALRHAAEALRKRFV